MSTLLDVLYLGAGSMGERKRRIHEQLVNFALDTHREGITARGIEKLLKGNAELLIKLKYSQPEYLLDGPQRLNRLKKADRELLTISVPIVSQILQKFEKDGLVVKKVIDRNYHLYRLRKPFEEQTPFWHIQGLVAYHNLISTLPWDGNDEKSLDDLIRRIGVFTTYVFLHASREFGTRLSDEDLERVRLDYIENSVNPRVMYNKVIRFFIPKKGQRSISQADFEHLEKLMKSKYPQYIEMILEGAKQAQDAVPRKTTKHKSR